MRLNLAQKVLYNVGAQIAGRAVGLVLGLLAIRVMTGYLGVDGYGRLAIVLALTALLLSITEFGITTVLAREISKAPDQVDLLGGTLLRFRLVSTPVAVALAAASVPFLPYPSDVKIGLLIGLVGTFFHSVGRTANAFFQANLRMDLLTVVDVVYKLVSLLLVVAVAVLDLGFYALVASIAFASVVYCGGNLALSRRFWRINVRAAPNLMRPLVRDSVGLWLVMIVGLLQFQGDMLLLSLLQPPSDVAIYSVAYKFIEQSFIISALFTTTVFPILALRIHEGRERSDEIIRRSFAFLLLQAIPLTLLLVVMASDLVRIIAPEEFAAAAEPLQVTALALPATFASTIFVNILIVLNRQRALISVSLATLAFNVGLNLYFIPLYSYMGAAWTTVATETLYFLMVFLVVRQVYGVRLDYSFLSRLAVPTALAAITVVGATALPATATAAAALTVFLLGVVAARVVTRADVRLVLGR
jgi:O-antigen/teichoic acid export membrane protein